jgi:hypothetical protein
MTRRAKASKPTYSRGKILEPYGVERDVTWFYAGRSRFELVHYPAGARTPVQINIPTRQIRAALDDLGFTVLGPDRSKAGAR